jgi:NADPH:quinone reductase-like Zn-dependent oxidoreductase
MRAMVCGHPASLGSLKMVSMRSPAPPNAGEITVALRASSLNYHDLAVVTGAIATPDGRIPLSDGAGEVIAIGERVTGYAIGDLVVSLFFPQWHDGDVSPQALKCVPGDSVHGYACECVTVPAGWFTRIPKNYDAASAATLTCAGLTAWRALKVHGDLRAGQGVLVMGSGSVSIFALQFAKALGATVIATSSSDAKLERLRALGADHLINYKDNPKWGSTVLEMTNGIGVDHIVEVGGAGTLNQSIIAARNGGHIALVGILAGFTGPVNSALVMSKQLRVQGLTVGSRVHQLEMIAAIDVFGIKPVIDSHFPLSQLATAFAHQQSGGHFGKIVVDI